MSLNVERGVVGRFRAQFNVIPILNWIELDCARLLICSCIDLWCLNLGVFSYGVLIVGILIIGVLLCWLLDPSDRP